MQGESARSRRQQPATHFRQAACQDQARTAERRRATGGAARSQAGFLLRSAREESAMPTDRDLLGAVPITPPAGGCPASTATRQATTRRRSARCCPGACIAPRTTASRRRPVPSSTIARSTRATPRGRRRPTRPRSGRCAGLPPRNRTNRRFIAWWYAPRRSPARRRCRLVGDQQAPRPRPPRRPGGHAPRRCRGRNQ